jgi:hypothetical protein
MEAMMDGTRGGPTDLDARTDPVRWEALVGAVVGAAELELRRRRRDVTLAGTLLAWARPALSAAATIALLVSASLALSVGRAPEEEASVPTLASALVPEEVAAWLVGGYEPTVTEVVVALEEMER